MQSLCFLKKKKIAAEILASIPLIKQNLISINKIMSEMHSYHAISETQRGKKKMLEHIILHKQRGFERNVSKQRSRS